MSEYWKKYNKDFVTQEEPQAPVPSENEMSAAIDAYVQNLYDPTTREHDNIDVYKYKDVNMNLNNIGGVDDFIDAARSSGLKKFGITSGTRSDSELEGLVDKRLKNYPSYETYPQEAQSIMKEVLRRGKGLDQLTYPAIYPKKGESWETYKEAYGPWENWRSKAEKNLSKYLKPEEVQNALNYLASKQGRGELGGIQSPHFDADGDGKGDKFDVSGRSLGLEGKSKKEIEDGLVKFLEELQNRGHVVKTKGSDPGNVFWEAGKDGKLGTLDDVIDVDLRGVPEDADERIKVIRNLLK